MYISSDNPERIHSNYVQTSCFEDLELLYYYTYGSLNHTFNSEQITVGISWSAHTHCSHSNDGVTHHDRNPFNMRSTHTDLQ